MILKIAQNSIFFFVALMYLGIQFEFGKDMKEFIHRRKVRLQDTDATGVLYFPVQLKMALEAFEDFLIHHQMPLSKILDSPYLMPVVHAEADYLAPVMVGDELDIHVQVEAVGTKSITLFFKFFEIKKKIEVGTAKVVHVTVDRMSRQSVPIPDALRSILQSKSTHLN